MFSKKDQLIEGELNPHPFKLAVEGIRAVLPHAEHPVTRGVAHGLPVEAPRYSTTRCAGFWRAADADFARSSRRVTGAVEDARRAARPMGSAKIRMKKQINHRAGDRVLLGTARESSRLPSPNPATEARAGSKLDHSPTT